MFGRILLILDISFLKPKYKKVPTDNCNSVESEGGRFTNSAPRFLCYFEATGRWFALDTLLVTQTEADADASVTVRLIFLR